MIKFRFIAATLAALVAGACAGKKVQVDPASSQVSKAGVVSMQVEWVKDKKKKFDTQVVLTNLSKEPQIIWLKDLACSRGGVKGNTTTVGARAGDMPIPLRPSVPATMILTCDNGVETAGQMELNIVHVYANPGGDGRTNGKVLAQNLSFQINAK